MTRSIWRLRLVATCLVLTAIAFAQSPGLIAADTKLDLTQDPGSFLGRALHLWDEQAFFGQLQNQAYGYLFPVGPFFWLGHALGLPEWAVQRTWWSVLLCVAFLGAVRLGRLLGLSPIARFAAGLVFALSPRMMSTLGPLSVESLPYALTPWVIVPLVRLRDGGPVRRAVALSAVAVTFMGGINAVATVVAASMGAGWIILEAHRSIRLRALTAWIGACTLATAWFVGPLVLLGKYSPPFLDWIESASVTTSITDGSAVMRGVTDWIAYIAQRGGPEWPAGWTLVTQQGPVLATAVLATAGLVGLLSWHTVHRRFLAAAVIVGFVLMTSPHVVDGAGWATGLLAEPLRTALDGALAPLRNVHKAEVWVRLPLSLGVGWGAAELVRRARRGVSTGWPAWRRTTCAVAAAVVVLAALGVASPALTGGLTAGRTFASVPGYWLDAAGWLGTHAARTRALVIPGSSFGTYLWGQSRDEPLQAFASTPWAVRDAVPLSSAGNIRMLDAIEALLSDGRGDPGLAAYLSRAGIGYLVVRNDLDPGRSDAPRPSLVHQSLAQSGGFSRTAEFGPLLSGFTGENITADGGVDGTYPAVEIYRVDQAPAEQRVALTDARDVVELQGESESLMGSIPVATGEATVRTVDLVPGIEPVSKLLTDSGRRVEVDFGRVHDNRSSTMTPTDAYSRTRAAHDYVVVPSQQETAVEYLGIAGVSASSSRGDVGGVTTDPSEGPWAAVDGSALTSWFPRDGEETAWWQLDLDSATDLGGGTLRLAWPFGRGTAGLTFTTPSGRRSMTVTSSDRTVRLPASLGTTTWLRIEVSAEPGTLGINEIRIPGVQARRTLLVPSRGDLLSLRARSGTRSPCVVGTPTNCLPSLWRVGEDAGTIDRSVSTDELTGTFEIDVQPTESDAAAVFAQPLRPYARAGASSSQTAGIARSPREALDRDPDTAWVAATGDAHPWFRVTLPHSSSISWLRFVRTAGLAASAPFAVDVAMGGRTFAAVTDSQGYVRFPATTTSQILITFNAVSPELSLDTSTLARTVLPVGVSELVLGEADGDRVASPTGLPVSTGCGYGPDVSIDGTIVRTRVSMPMTALLTGGFGTAVPCSPVNLAPGLHRIVVSASAWFAPVSLRWGRGADPVTATPSSAAVTVIDWSSTSRVVDVAAVGHPQLLELAENSNAGWVATHDGVTLPAVRVDGWRQAFVVPAGTSGAISIEFTPDRQLRVSLVLGLALALLLVALAVRPSSPLPSPLPARDRLRPAHGAGASALVVGALVAGPLGGAVALATSTLVRRGGRREVWAVAWGATVALLPSVVAPWPGSTQLESAGRLAAALAVSVGTGLVLGALVSACWARRDEPTAEPDARRAGRWLPPRPASSEGEGRRRARIVR